MKQFPKKYQLRNAPWELGTPFRGLPVYLAFREPMRVPRGPASFLGKGKTWTAPLNEFVR
jgi:hypothetical protein